MRQRNRIRRRRREPWEELSFLFNVNKIPWNQITWRKGIMFGKALQFLVVSGALSKALENPKERIIFVSGRTDNRSRSPR